MVPHHLDVKPGIPDFLKARARPVREALYQDAKNEFDRMRTYFYEPSTSSIACPLVIAPKATIHLSASLKNQYHMSNSHLQRLRVGKSLTITI